MVIVQSGVLVMLSRFERGHFDSVSAPLPLCARKMVAAAIVTVVLLFDPCSQVLTSHFDYLASKALLSLFF